MNKNHVAHLLPKSIKPLLTHFYSLLSDRNYRWHSLTSRFLNNGPAVTRIDGVPLQYLDRETLRAMYESIFLRRFYSFPCSPESEPSIIDCGANIGLSHYFWKKNLPRYSGLAFEADPIAFSVLEKNLKSLGVRVTPINAAVSSSEGKSILFRNYTDSSTLVAEGRGALPRIDRPPDDSTISVQTVRLSNYIIRPVDFLKIDIEGSEFDVIQEIRERLALVRYIFIEYHLYTTNPKDLSLIFSPLHAAGFSVYVDSIWGSRRLGPFQSLSKSGFTTFGHIFAINRNFSLENH